MLHYTMTGKLEIVGMILLLSQFLLALQQWCKQIELCSIIYKMSNHLLLGLWGREEEEVEETLLKRPAWNSLDSLAEDVKGCGGGGRMDLLSNATLFLFTTIIYISPYTATASLIFLNPCFDSVSAYIK